MDCKNCELKQRQFYCVTCLKTHLRDYRSKINHASKERDDQVARTEQLLGYVEERRYWKAGVSAAQDRVKEVQDGLAQLRRQNERTRDRIRTLRDNLHMRRRVLGQAQIVPLSRDEDLGRSIAQTNRDLLSLSDTLARARSGLVQELVEVFHVVEVGGRPPIAGKAGTKGEWTIGDLILPVPGDIRRYPPQHINAVITHTVHFLSLLTFYLGVKLPFEITWSGKKLGVGQPWIGAIKGTETGSWAKWFTKHSLHLSSSPSPAPGTPGALDSTSQRPPITQTLSESYVEQDPDAAPTSPSFSTAFAMLLYNVCYLAHTQSVDVPLAQAGDVLSNLWAVCCSPDLGRRSHETRPLLPAPTPPSFPLDFSQLLQAMTANPRAKQRRRPVATRKPSRKHEKIPEVDEDGWDLVEDIGDVP
ncbi:hypothetical protein PUNSTDRAFT_102195 [Punctularia strigosozonata HHB-11173 SS5]|uniref:uncharacterized protein n=1 Tax=Punctularia strigosozonata (strain HHB-11173) TaxID=741275 RepID=UPI000441785E|nr:uncharacterized protein PUNSTDRAFT_102195 [Punctularia strigosozonata HHB-11173 SS5]EIN08728.1 hypothetical protein PUNSTDRAFT_102195 [Punctularia strigosozonata HHB-11173 SS5]